MKMTLQIRRALAFAGLGAVFASAPIVACASLPDVSYVGGDEAGTDATTSHVPESGTADTGANDAGIDDGSSPGDDAEDDSAADTSANCGDASVTSCNLCLGYPLQCKVGKSSQCVSTCSDCAAGMLPCWHCPSAKVTRGTCTALNGKGVLNCGAGVLCTCDAATDCPPSAGAGEICTLVDAASTATKCLTCGEALTNGEACVTSTGAAGTCATGTSAPACQ
jgi:hypothetical protein